MSALTNIEPAQLSIVQSDVARAFAAVRKKHVWMHYGYVLAALCYCFALGLGTAPASLTFAALAVASVLNLYRTWPLYRYILRDSVGWLMLAWTTWEAITVLWSPDQEQGTRELRSFRAALTPLMLWPVIDYVAWLVLAFLIGVAAQNVAQLGQALHLIARKAGDGPRLRGITHPIHTATLCLIAMCCHLSATLLRIGWFRWLSFLGLIASAVGMVATGSRGPWIAAAITLPLAFLTIIVRRPQSRSMAVRLLIMALPCVLAAWPLLHHIVQYRMQQTQTDVERVEEGQYGMDVGYRLASWQAAWEAFQRHPLIGEGAGGFAEAAARSSQADVVMGARHAHSMYLHVLATAGAVGLLTLLTLIAVSLRRAWFSVPDNPYADGIFFGIFAWLIAAGFDSYQLNGQMLGVFAMLLALGHSLRPRAFPLGIAPAAESEAP